MMSSPKFEGHLELILEKQKRNHHLTESRARNIREKGEQLIRLFVELDKRNLLKSPNQVDFKRIGNVLKNFDEVNTLNATLLKLYKGYTRRDGTSTDVPIKDDGGKQYSISLKQFVIQWGWAYCSLCELMKTILTEIIRFPTKPAGIGEVIMALEDFGGLDMSYFDFVEPRVRNSFFHLDFCLDGEKIFIAGRRTPLKVMQLVEITMRIDAIIFPLIGIIQLFFDHIESKRQPGFR